MTEPMPACPLCRPRWAICNSSHLRADYAASFFAATLESIELTTQPLCDEHWAHACKRRGILRLGVAS